MMTVHSILDSVIGEHLEGRRTGLRAAFKLARQRWREYGGQAVIVVRWNGVEVTRDITEMSLSRRKWHFGKERGIPQ